MVLKKAICEQFGIDFQSCLTKKLHSVGCASLYSNSEVMLVWLQSSDHDGSYNWLILRRTAKYLPTTYIFKSFLHQTSVILQENFVRS